MTRKINQAGLDLIKRFEGCRLQAYKDAVGIWTIGYGMTGPDIKEGLTITQQQADEGLLKRLQDFYHLDEYLSEQVNDNQFAALVALAYNIGLRALKLSGIIKEINEGKDPDDLWMQYVHGHVNGQAVVLKGLVTRRKAELGLFHEVS